MANPANVFVVDSDAGGKLPNGRIALVNEDGSPWSGGGDAPSVAWDDVTGKPATFPPAIGTTATTAMAGNTALLAIGTTATTAAAGNHNHAVTADAGSGLSAAANIQALAVALSTRIKALEDAAV